jgi:hypothetical protein
MAFAHPRHPQPVQLTLQPRVPHERRHRPAAVSVLFAAACGAAGLGIFAGRLARPALVLAGLLGLVFWVAEGFGGIVTGQATDPNSGPLLILLAACFWPAAHAAATASAAKGGGADHSPSSLAALP